MPEDRTVLDHLLEGRDALQREVARLTAAIEQLDSVLGRIGTVVGRGNAPLGDPAAPVIDGAADPVEPAVTVSTPAEPVNPPAEVEATAPARPRAVRKAPARKASRPRSTGTSAEPPKSIRVHVLEMLQAENREFGLAEIIDRVHGAGIQAHDDAVRSITIKLMKDGRVERVGRGQYRLARRGSAARASAAVATAPRVTESAPEPAADPEPVAAAEPISSPADVDPGSDVLDASGPAEPEPTETESAEAESAEAEPAEPGPADPGLAEPETDTTGDQAPAADVTPDKDAPADRHASYAPSLNLGQPWNS